MNLLSRFFGWAIEHGHTTVNPVRQIPMGRRPRQAQKRDVPWLADDAIVRKIMAKLTVPLNLMFYLGNRSGLRWPGELVGLRMSDFDFVDEGAIRVRFSYDGPLKEDKHGDGKCKWAPVPEDFEAAMRPWLARRKAEGAGPEDYVFVKEDGAPFTRIDSKGRINRAWHEAIEAIEKETPGLKIPVGYQATRHSFTTRSLVAGASLDEVSAALGHSSPVVTRRYYDHFVRKTFSSTLRQGLGIAPEGDGGTLLPMKREG